MAIEKGTFTSVWSDGTEITTDCKFDRETNNIPTVESSSDDSDHGNLVKEYVTDKDGVEHIVCENCHDQILRPATVINKLQNGLPEKESGFCCDCCGELYTLVNGSLCVVQQDDDNEVM